MHKETLMQGIALGRKVVVERVSGRIEITIDNVPRDIAVSIGESTHDAMLDAGYVRLLDRW
jgi:hypothetical protein